MRLSYCASLIIALAVSAASAQVSTGAPPFSSIGGGPFDHVNLGNLNVHFEIPVVNKAGRGIPFTYNLSYDSSIWYPVTVSGTTSWKPGANWGWTADSTAALGFISKSTIRTSFHSMIHPCVGTDSIYATTYSYIDSRGKSHPFPGSTTDEQVRGGSCTNSDTYGPTLNANATDGSGYILLAPANQSLQSTVTTVSGQVLATGNVPYTGQGLDSNGNIITVNTSTQQFFDTLSNSTPVLTVSGSGTPTSPFLYTYTPPSLSNVAVSVNYKEYTVATAFGFTGGLSITEYPPTSIGLVDNISLPDGTTYSFKYEDTPGSCTPLAGTDPASCVTGRIVAITLPTAGAITYCYSGSLCPANSGGPHGTGIFSDGSTATLTRTLSASAGAAPSTWTYSRVLVAGSPGPGSTWTTTIEDPSSPSNYTVSNFAEDSTTTGTSTVATYNLYETQRKVYQGSVSTTNLLQTTLKCYNNNFASCTTATVGSPITQTDTFTQFPAGSNPTRLSEITYNGQYSGSGLVDQDKEYDFGVTLGASPTGNPIRQTQISYASLPGILNRPSTVTVKDWSSGSAVTMASTSYSYDGSTVTVTSGTPQHVAISSSRGNLTEIATQANSGTTLYQTFSYYDTGNLNTSTGLSTSFGSPGPTTTYNYASGTSCGNSFITSISEPLGLSRSMTWNCTGGVETQTTDENSKTVTTNYSDAYFWRPAYVQDQAANQTIIAYISPTTAESTLSFNSGNSIVDLRSTVDGFGRPTLSQRLQGPGATSYDTAETDYNLVGLPYHSTMPFSAAAGGTSSSAPKVVISYDALDRPLSVTDAGGGTVTYAYANNDVLVAAGGSGGAQIFEKQLEYDGLGRLSSVCEITSASGSGTCGQGATQTGYWTKYTYDALGHLLTVTQNAQASSGHQARSYSYDLLGRLTSESNPESGTTSYTYDIACTTTPASAGDLTRKVDNAGNNSCFAYDALHRLVGEGWNNVCRFFNYDTSVTPPSGVTVANTKGRLLEAYTNNCTATTYTDEWFSYSPRGELNDEYESTLHSGGYYHTTASYWPSGSLETLGGIPSVPTLYYGASNLGGTGLDGEGRYTQVTASLAPNPVTSVTYSTSSTSNPLGSVVGVTYGSSDTDAFSYDPNTGRAAGYMFSVNGSTDTGALTWNTNGTLGAFSIADGISGASDSQSCLYSYDDLGRVGGTGAGGSSVKCGSTWAQTFTYDAFGNIVKSGSSSFAATYSAISPKNQFSLSGMTVSYDGDGNLTTDNLNSYTWDPNWGNMTSVSTGASTVTATFDAFGRVVEQSNGSSNTEILWSPVGKVALLNGASLAKAFVGLPGRGTAVYNSSGLAYYRHADSLGSSRLSSTQARGLYSSVAYAPFGEQYAASGTADPSFTSQNSDTVSSLYDFQFRRLSPSQGRWISPDPAGLAAVDPTNPQTWNRYAYVANNPLSLVDPLGLQFGNTCPTDPTGEDGSCGGGGGSGGGGDSADCSAEFTDCSGVYLDGIETSESTVSMLLNSGWAVECPNGECEGVSIDGVLVYFSAYELGSTYTPYAGPHSLFSALDQALIAGALYAQNQSLMGDGNEQCGSGYQVGDQFSYTTSVEGSANTCNPFNPSLGPQMPGANAIGAYHSHGPSMDPWAQVFSTPGGPHLPGAVDTTFASSFGGFPLSVATGWGNVMIYYGKSNCQTVFAGSLPNLGDYISICP